MKTAFLFFSDTRRPNAHRRPGICSPAFEAAARIIRDAQRGCRMAKKRNKEAVMKYKKMFEPVTMGKLNLRNRIVMGPMGTGFADENHAPTKRLARYYEERAKGGVGLIIVEHTISQPVGYWGPHAGEIFSEASVPGWKMVVDAVHAQGAKIAIEIGHMGRSTNAFNTGGITPIAPSAVPCHIQQHEVHEVTYEEIQNFKADYLQCVKNAKEAGFDAVMLHFTNGYFLAQWLSGRTNKRTDEYGGTFENRLRLPLEIIQMIKREIGPGYPLFARLASSEPNGGRDVEETKLIAKAIEEAGVDLIDINSGSFSDYDYEFPPYFRPQGFNLKEVEAIRKSVSIPVIAGGRIIEPRMAEQILVEDRADLVEINRNHITDPEWVKKAASGEEQSIRRCIGCTRCIDEILPDRLKCSVNPFVGMEDEYAITEAEEKKKVLVIGGGPAGLQAALVAAQRGHCVTLVEKAGKLGGMAAVAAIPPLKWETASLITTLAYDAKKAGVEILLNTPANAEYVKTFGADEVILATGASPVVPKIPGVDVDNAITAVSVLQGKNWTGDNVAIIGGGMVGLETADFLSEYGKSVTIYDMLDTVGKDMWTAIKIQTDKRLKAHNVKIITSAAIKEIKDGVISYEKNGESVQSPAYDTVIFAAGMRSNNQLAEELTAGGIDFKQIGDCSKPSQFHEALVAAVEATIHM